MTAPISNGPTTHGYTTMRDATRGRKGLVFECCVVYVSSLALERRVVYVSSLARWHGGAAALQCCWRGDAVALVSQMCLLA